MDEKTLQNLTFKLAAKTARVVACKLVTKHDNQALIQERLLRNVEVIASKLLTIVNIQARIQERLVEKKMGADETLVLLSDMARSHVC